MTHPTPSRGDNKRVRSLAGAATRFVDLHGHTVIPGLGDNHDHLYDSAKVILRGISLQGVASVSEALERIREAASRAQPGQTVFTSALRLPRAEREALTIPNLIRFPPKFRSWCFEADLAAQS